MRLQRVRGAGNRIEMQIVKWTAEGVVKGRCRVFYNMETYVSCQGYVSIL